ncbi:hypothetical protein AB0F36_07875 [Streptomyces sp. NPDC029080]|uniref:hypothetical protein n=1 Tax=Streptomyces sp. NPDC029080 TaxID=3155017 RepID=UPI0033CAD036
MDETTQWGSTEHILARISDALEVSNYLFIRANASAKDADKFDPPKPLPRPGDPEPVEVKPAANDFASGEELSNFFASMSNI